LMPRMPLLCPRPPRSDHLRQTPSAGQGGIPIPSRPSWLVRLAGAHSGHPHGLAGFQKADVVVWLSGLGSSLNISPASTYLAILNVSREKNHRI
jgi:hypothetical protein